MYNITTLNTMLHKKSSFIFFFFSLEIMLPHIHQIENLSYKSYSYSTNWLWDIFRRFFFLLFFGYVLSAKIWPKVRLIVSKISSWQQLKKKNVTKQRIHKIWFEFHFVFVFYYVVCFINKTSTLCLLFQKKNKNSLSRW